MFSFFIFFFFNDTATTEIYTLSLHDALPICDAQAVAHLVLDLHGQAAVLAQEFAGDRKSTRLNSSHVRISYAVFCLKKKKQEKERVALCCKKDAKYCSSYRRATNIIRTSITK